MPNQDLHWQLYAKNSGTFEEPTEVTAHSLLIPSSKSSTTRSRITSIEIFQSTYVLALVAMA